MGGFESLLPCQLGGKGRVARGIERPEDVERQTMATQVFKVKNGETPGSPGGVSPAGAFERVREWLHGSRQFLHEVRVELRQVTWPSPEHFHPPTGITILPGFFFDF